jgi:hypothetical protein
VSCPRTAPGAGCAPTTSAPSAGIPPRTSVSGGGLTPPAVLEQSPCAAPALSSIVFSFAGAIEAMLLAGSISSGAVLTGNVSIGDLLLGGSLQTGALFSGNAAIEDLMLSAWIIALTDIIPFQKFDGPVYAILPTNDGCYVSGRFTRYGGVTCKSIVKILKTGLLDTTFKPGGVVGGGFDATYPYFAPTQLQGALDGGVFCGVSYAFLPEPKLYFDRLGGSSYGSYDQLSLNGVATGPVVKLKRDGSVDTSFNSDALVGVADLPKFMSFHIYEVLGRAYYSHTRNVSCVEPFPDGSDYELGGVNFATLDLRTLGGSLINRIFIRSSLAIVNENFPAYHQVFVDEAVGLVAWSGLNTNQRTGGGLVQYQGNSETKGVPLAWKVYDVNDATARTGMLCFDLGLGFNEASNWAGYTLSGVAAGLVTSMIPFRVTRGCFRGSLVASAPVDGDAIGHGDEGRWASTESGTHKGCLHFCFDQSFTGGQYYKGFPAGGFSLAPFPGTARLRVYSPYRSAASQFDAVWHKDLEDETVPASCTAHEGEAFFASDAPDGSYDMRVTPAIAGCEWTVTAPAFLSVTGPTHLWDLRNLGALDMADTAQHGFNPFFGALVDNDGCHNCVVLKAMHDPDHRQATFSTPATLGVFVTGMIEKFKGVTQFSTHGQLAKIRHDGNWDTAFVPPTFGPESMTLGGETHHEKINCASISSGGNSLYVGGKFTQLVDGETHEVGHICCLDINTGALQS